MSNNNSTVEATNFRVLVVDDEPLSRALLVSILQRRSGVRIVGEAHSGETAIRAIKELSPEIVFLDISMPNMSGLDVAATMGDSMPYTVFVTAYQEHAIKAFELNAVDYVVKPLSDERLQAALDRAIRFVEERKLSTLASQILAITGRRSTPEIRGPRFLVFVAASSS